MGIFSWWSGSGKEASSSTKDKQQSSDQKKLTKSVETTPPPELPDMNGAMEVPRPADVTVFEFGSAAASGDKITLSGYCPVTEELEPCRWEILPAGTASNAPQFRYFSRLTEPADFKVLYSKAHLKKATTVMKNLKHGEGTQKDHY